MATRPLGIIMNGVTGRMGANRHLIRSILAIRAKGGVGLVDGDRVMPDPILAGRDATQGSRLADRRGVKRRTTDVDSAFSPKLRPCRG